MATLLNSASETITRSATPYKSETLTVIVDFSKTGNVMAQNDILEAIAIPAKTFVKRIQWEILTVEGAARNFAIGDGSGTSSWIATTSANSLANGSSTLSLTEGVPNTVTGYSAGKYYSTADTIDILAVTAGGLTTGKIKVQAVVDYH